MNSVPRHYIPSEISTAIGDRTETRSIYLQEEIGFTAIIGPFDNDSPVM